jgi:hypothetical protein
MLQNRAGSHVISVVINCMKKLSSQKSDVNGLLQPAKIHDSLIQIKFHAGAAEIQKP